MNALDEPLPCTGQGVTLRRLRLTDLREFQAYRCDPLVGLYQGWSPVPDEEAEAFLQYMSASPLLAAGEWTQVAIADALTEELLGDIGLFISDDFREAEIGFSLARAHQNKGIATRAVGMALELIFARTPVLQVFAATDVRNERSIRLLERLAFERLETRAASVRGQSCTEHVYGLPRP